MILASVETGIVLFVAANSTRGLHGIGLADLLVKMVMMLLVVVRVHVLHIISLFANHGQLL